MSTDFSSSSATSGALSSSSLPASTASALLLSSFSTINVKSHVPVVLDLQNPNFTRWSTFFKAMVGKLGLLSYIDGSSNPAPADPVWVQTDYAIKSWIYGSTSDAVLDLAMEDDQTARDLFIAIENLFNNNKESRAIYLHNAFHSITQGDSSISNYCQRVKQLADSLRDVGHAVSDSQLVLNLLRGLNPRFSNTAENIANTTPFLTFAKARSMLALKELRLANESKVATDTALVASAPSTCGPGGCRNSAPSSPAQFGDSAPRDGVGRDGAGRGAPRGGAPYRGRGGRRGGRGRCGGYGGGFGGGYSQSPNAQGPWVCFNPWIMNGAHQWRPAPNQSAPGILGAAPSNYQ